LASGIHVHGRGVLVMKLPAFLTSRPKQKMVMLAAALLVSAGFSVTTAPPSEAATCSITSWGEVDGYHGTYIVYPSIVCYGSDFQAVSLYSMKPNFSRTPTATYDPARAGSSYPGYGLVFNLSDGRYCAFITATIRTIWGPKYQSAQHCYTL
jgi:hypothetical protein